MGADAFFRRIALSQPGGVRGAVAIGLLCGAGGLLLSLLLTLVYGGSPDLTLLLPAVIFAALWAGRTGGFVATLTCLAGGGLLSTLMPGLDLQLWSNPVLTAGFVVVAIFCTVLAASLRTVVRNLEDTVVRLRTADTGLSESEQRFRLVADSIPNLAWMAEPDGAIYWYNQRWYDYTGTTLEQMSGWGWQAVHDPDYVDGVTARFKQCIESGEPWEDTFPLRGASGDWGWFLSRAQPVRDAEGRIVRWFGTNTDITAQRHAEAALRESEERFRLMADTAPSPVWLTNVEGEVEFVNAALVAFYGQPAEAIMGHVWKQAIHPDDVAAVAAAQAASRPARLPYGFECRFERADGAWRWLRIAVNPRFDSDGDFKGYVGLSFDVTETRELLDALAAQESRQSFLLSLTDRLQDMGSPDEVMSAVERALGEVLGADRVGYGELDSGRRTISMSRDWTAGVSSVQGEFGLEALGANLIADLAEGRTIHIADVVLDTRTAGDSPVFEGLQARAIIRVPVIRAGQMRAFLYVHSARPRDWTTAEVALVEEIAARTWIQVERTRAQVAVAESEARFRAIADTAPVLIWVTRQDRARAFVNQAYVAFNGGTYEQARDADWRAAIHPDDQDRILAESVAGEAAGEPFSMEGRYLRHDGEYRWLRSVSRPRLGTGGEVIGFVGVAYDVTDIRDTNARLAAAAAERDAILGQLAEGVIVTDPDGAITFVNDAARRQHGVAHLDVGPDDYADSYHLFTDDGRPYPPEDLPLARAVLKGETVTDARWRIRRPDGAEVIAVGNARPVNAPDGSPIGAVLTLRDETARVQAEEALRRLNEQLEDRVGEALAEKAKAEADLMHAQRMEAVGRLTGGVAHDFNNLLTVVIGALDMILRSPDDAARRKKLGEAALSAARRGERLTHQLLAFSRRQALRPEPFDLNVQIRECEPLLQRAVGEAIEFKLKLRRGGAPVSVDPAQFEAALLNLIVNARDAVVGKAGKGVGRITVQTNSCEIEPGEVLELAPGDYICITVTDNGAGMDPAVLNRVFEPFFTTKAVGKGTGLGLSQVYGFARQSGGGVKALSTLGRGTEISLYLPPLAVADLAAPRAPRDAGGAIPAGRRLLLVEDDASVAAIAVALLEGMGLDVVAVENGPEAMAALSGARFDVMLSDVVMPGGMTGIELARRCAELHPAMRILLTSGYAGEDVDAALADAPWPFLRKPYSADQLREALGELLPLNA